MTSIAPSNLGTSYRLGLGFGKEWKLAGRTAELVAQAELYNQLGPSLTFNPETRTTSSGPANYGPLAPAPGTWGGTTLKSMYEAQVPSLWLKFSWADLTVFARAEQYVRHTPFPNYFNVTLMDWNNTNTKETDQWVSVDARYTIRASERVTVVAHAYADAYGYNQTQEGSLSGACPATLPATNLCRQHIIGASRWMGLEGQATADWFGDNRVTTFAGFDERLQFVEGRTDSLDGTTGAALGTIGAAKATENLSALYIQQRVQPIAIIHLNAGLRYDNDSRGGQHLSPRIAASVDSWKGGIIKAIYYSSAFRPPSFYEAYYAGNGQIANAALKPETVESVESTIEQRWGGHRVLMGVFGSRWFNMSQITQAPGQPAGTSQYQNTSTINNYGANALYDGKVGELRLGASMTAAHSTRDNLSTGESMLLPTAPQLYGNARVAYPLPNDLPCLALSATYIGVRPADRAIDGGFPVTPYAPANVTLQLTASGIVPSVKGLSYRISATYNTASRSAYVAGPNQFYNQGGNQDAPGTATLAPILRGTAFATLQYDIGG